MTTNQPDRKKLPRLMSLAEMLKDVPDGAKLKAVPYDFLIRQEASHYKAALVEISNTNLDEGAERIRSIADRALAYDRKASE